VNSKKDFSMEKNLKIFDKRVRIVFSVRKKENKSGHRTVAFLTRKRRRRVTSHVISTLDGLSINVDNLTFAVQKVLQGELSLMEAFLPELLESLANFQEEEE
jgi:hypothetical protein